MSPTTHGGTTKTEISSTNKAAVTVLQPCFIMLLRKSSH